MLTTLALSQTPASMTDLESQIYDDLVAALRNTGYAQLSTLNVRVDGGEVRLGGRLPSYFLKQKAHYAALRVSGVQTLIDDIDVVN